MSAPTSSSPAPRVFRVTSSTVRHAAILARTLLAAGTVVGCADLRDPAMEPAVEMVAGTVTRSFQDGVAPDVHYDGTRDAKIARSHSHTRYGHEDTSRFDGTSPNDTQDNTYTLLKWDVSSIPSRSNVRAAQIVVDVTEASPDTYQVYALRRSWTESQVTYDDASSSTSWGSAGADDPTDRAPTVIGTITPVSTGSHTITLNQAGVAAVQRWVSNPSTNHGVIIANTANHDGATIRTREDGTAANHPRLDIALDPLDPLATERAACHFTAGARVAASLGFTPAQRASLPVQHVIVLMQENRSFDHYLGHTNRDDVDGVPADYSNALLDNHGHVEATYRPAHASTTCNPNVTHSWNSIHTEWNDGAMDGFALNALNKNSDPRLSLYYFTGDDIPFYDWLYRTYAMSDRFFCSVIGPTWPNRDYLYAATSDGVTNTSERAINVRTLFDELTAAGVTWGAYVDGGPYQDCIGWNSRHAGLRDTATFIAQATAGTLPQVSFIDGRAAVSEHPTADISDGEAFVRSLYVAVANGRGWPGTVMFLTYDEGGGFFDHVTPPSACVPDGRDTSSRFDRLGVRVPVVAISPFARAGYVSHSVHETASITRFIETVFDLPALTARDANADAMLDLFDFSRPSPTLSHPPAAPASGRSRCRP